MRVYPTSQTHYLEDKAKALGYDVDIRVIEPHDDGRFFVTAIKGQPMKNPSPLGFSEQEAIETLRRGTWKAGRIDGYL
jgi:hypothetical protein